MSLYRCSLYGEAGLQPGMKSIYADSDAEARKLVMDLLRDDPLIERVEVWREADLAFRLNRHQAKLESLS